MPCGYTRPVDLRTIDMRLAARAYGSSLELFLADVRMVSVCSVCISLFIARSLYEGVCYSVLEDPSGDCFL